MSAARRYVSWTAPSDGSEVQVVEVGEGRCHVGYRPGPDAEDRGWRHWGEGAGGFEAAVERMDASPSLVRGRAAR